MEPGDYGLRGSAGFTWAGDTLQCWSPDQSAAAPARADGDKSRRREGTPLPELPAHSWLMEVRPTWAVPLNLGASLSSSTCLLLNSAVVLIPSSQPKSGFAAGKNEFSLSCVFPASAFSEVFPGPPSPAVMSSPFLIFLSF